MDRALAHRLLLACGACYTHIVDPRPPGWIGAPRRIERTAPPWQLPIDLALAGRFPEGVVVAFRGTLPMVGSLHPGKEVLLDWANNGAALCQPCEDYPGRVHRGFSESLRRLWEPAGDDPGLAALVAELLAGDGPRRLLVTGHSKGGALANLFAWRAARSWPDVTIDVVTFAAARAGNGDFAEAYAAEPRITCTRYEAALDLVPWLPLGWDRPGRAKALVRRLWPALLHGDYQPVGTRIASRLSFVEWRARKAAEIRALFAGGFRPGAWRHEFIEAHLIGPGTDYDALVRGEAEG